MPLQAKVLSSGRSIKSLVSPVISVTIHSDIQRALGFPDHFLKPFSWLRFIDDIDMKWTHGKTILEAFLRTANSFHPTIRFTAEVSNDKHVFLDTMSHLADAKVAVDLYTKPTDSRQYLLPTSCHPPHCSKNIPYSLALRIRRICSDDETLNTALQIA